MQNYFKELKLNTELILLFSSIYLTDISYGGDLSDGATRIRTPFHFIFLSLPILWFVSNNKKTSRFILFFLRVGFPIIFLFLLSYLFLPNGYHFIMTKTIPFLIYYLLAITISLTILSFNELERIIDSIFFVARISIVFGLIFYFISFLPGIDILIDPVGQYFRLSGLGGEPSNMALPVAVGLIYSILKNKTSFLIVTSIATFLTFSLTNYLVFLVTLSVYLIAYNFFDLTKKGFMKLTFKKSGIVIVTILTICIFIISIDSIVFQEFTENILSFFYTGQFSDMRAIATLNFYNLAEKLNIPFGFGFASSEALAQTFNNGKVFDFSIFTSFDMYFGFFIGRLLKLIYLFIIIDSFRALPNQLRNNQINQLYISLYTIASFFKGLGSFVLPWGLINIIGVIFLKYRKNKNENK